MASLALSIVSHGQGKLVELLLDDLATLDFSGFESVQILVTLNISEDESFLSKYLKDVTVIRNFRLLGFGANHNQAFASSEADYFIIINPDIRISESFARHILACQGSDWGCMAPVVVAPQGEVEDSARRFPTLSRIARRVFLNQRGSDYPIHGPEKCVPVDWVAGMFMIFRSDVFRALNGFDHRYFMYLEDADICKRANEAGFPVLINTGFSVLHDARRNSFKSVTHLRWHLRSMFRFIFGF